MPRDLRTMNSKKDRYNNGTDIRQEYRDRGYVPEVSDAEKFVTKSFEVYAVIRYWFFYAFAIVGIVSYFMKQYNFEYAATALCVISYFFLCKRHEMFGYIFLLIVFSGAIGFFLLGGDLKSVCFGVLCAFVIRQIGKQMLYRFVRMLIDASKYAK